MGNSFQKLCFLMVFPVFCRLWGHPNPPTKFTRIPRVCPVDSLFQRVFSRSSDVVAANKVLRHADDGALNSKDSFGDLKAVN